MKKMILFSEQKSRGELIQFVWENQFEVAIENVYQLDDFKLKMQTVCGALFCYLCLNELDPSLEQSFVTILGINTTNKFLKLSESSIFDNNLVKDLFLQQGILEEIHNLEYCKIRPAQFLCIGEAICDLYLRLGEGKFLKIIKKGDLFGRDLFEHYQKKKISFFYIKQDEYKVYVETLGKIVFQQLQSDQKNIPRQEKNELFLNSLDMIHSNLLQIGVSGITIDITQKLISNVVNDLENQEEIWKILKAKMSTHNFLSEHSLGVAFIASAICEEMQWTSSFVKKKLVMSALLHDIALANDQLAKMNSDERAALKSLDPKAYKDFMEHPQNASILVNSLQDVSGNMEKVIIEHHERPDGSGFPNGLNAMTISPLGCLFILAEDFYIRLSRAGFSLESRDKILNELQQIYNKGNFKKTLQALIEVFV